LLLTDNPAGRKVAHYTDAKKLEAVQLWLVIGNLRIVSASLNIPYETIRSWRASKWWDTLVTEIRTEGSIALSNRTRKIAERAMEITLDRLDNGDWFFNQTSATLERKPVAMRDAHQVAVSFMDRTMKLDAAPQAAEQAATVNDRLTQLAEAFAKMAQKTTKLEVVDVPFTEYEEVQPQEIGYQSQEADAHPEEVEGINAIPEERGQGLQARGSVGEDQEAVTFEGSCSEDSGPETGGEDHR
jgi:hypothetical protein